MKIPKLPDLDYKKVFLLLGFIFTAAFFSWLIFRIFFGAPTTPDQENINLVEFDENGIRRPITNTSGGGLSGLRNNANTNTSLPDTNINRAEEEDTTKAVEKLTVGSVRGFTLSKNNLNATFYNSSDGKFYTIDSNGDTKAISEKVFYDVDNVEWSNDKNQAVIEYPDGSNIIYDFDTDKQTTIPIYWDEFDFSIDDNKIVTKSMDSNPDNNKLVIADIKTGNTKILENLGDAPGKFQINISPDNQIVAFFTENIGLDMQEIYPIGQNDERFNSFIIDGQNFQGKWSPTGDKILYSVYNPDEEYMPNLWIINKTGTSKQRIIVDTWSEKCTFYNEDIVYCGVPQDLDAMMGLSPNLALAKNDLIYRIDLNLNRSQLIDTGDNIFNVKEIMVTANESEIYFTDRRTGRLFKINL